MSPLTLEAFAKVNLTLEVYGKRPDGYHALRSVVQPVSLADTLTFSPVVQATATARLTTDTGYGEKDLIVRAANALASVSGRVDLPAYHVRVTKRIPAGGGLGGGSADAAATLRALNELWALGFSPERLAAIGAAVGSDVPALVLAQHYRQAVWMEGRGETVELVSPSRPMPIGALPSQHLVLANPGVFTATPAVFARCVSRAAPTDEIVNDLESAAITLHPEIADAAAALRKAGLRAVRMSGSGATVFGFAADAVEAERVAAHMRSQGYAAWPATA